MIPWGITLWDQQSAVEEYTGDGIQFLARAQDFARRRSAIEAEYAKSLSRLSKEFRNSSPIREAIHGSDPGSASFLGEDDVGQGSAKITHERTGMKVITGTIRRRQRSIGSRLQVLMDPAHHDDLPEGASLRRAWNALIEETDSVGEIHNAISENLESEIVEQIKSRVQRYMVARKEHLNQLKTFRQQLRRTQDDVDKLRVRAEAAAKAADEARISFEKISRDGGKGSNFDKLRADYEQKAALAKSAVEQRQRAVSAAERLQQRHFQEDVPTVFNALQGLDHDRLELIKETLGKFIAILKKATQEETQRLDIMRKEVSGIDPVAIINEFTIKRKSGKQLPVFGDSATAMILENLADGYDNSRPTGATESQSIPDPESSVKPAKDALPKELSVDDIISKPLTAEGLRKASAQLAELERAMAETARATRAVESLKSIYLREYTGSMAPAGVAAALNGADAQLSELHSRLRSLEARQRLLTEYISQQYGETLRSPARALPTEFLDFPRSSSKGPGSVTNRLRARSEPSFLVAEINQLAVPDDNWATSLMQEVYSRLSATQIPNNMTTAEPLLSHLKPELNSKRRSRSKSDGTSNGTATAVLTPLIIQHFEESEPASADDAYTKTGISSIISDLSEFRAALAKQNRSKDASQLSDNTGLTGAVPTVRSKPAHPVRVMYNFDAQPGSCELSVVEGEELDLLDANLEEAPGWVKAKNVHGIEGYVPHTYISTIKS